MAHKIEYMEGSRFYTVMLDDALSWNSIHVFPDGMRVVGIECFIEDQGGYVIIRDTPGDDVGNGGRIFSFYSSGTFQSAHRRYGYHHKSHRGTLCKPYIHAADVSGTVIVTFELA